MSIKEQIGQRIQAARQEKGLTLKALAGLTDDLKQSRINNWERGDRTPGPEEIKQLAKALDVSAAYLMCLTDEKQPKKIPGLGALIPILDYQQACDPVTAIEAIKSESNQGKVSFIPVGADLAQRLGENAFALKVKDESMDPELKPNDLIITKFHSLPSPGNFVVSRFGNTQEVVIRRYREISINEDLQEFELKAENDNWGSIKIKDNPTKYIVGVVCSVLRIFSS
ncbi:putative prophage repressor CI-like protein [Legionella rubrilucens]|uniref:Putative prophage repressor CI-like protein n=1 Tax=Legionella rubrilucens TaxID=458 RepID=A0A0W0XY24_9GAMM|nr:LexA family transcriptional regulator [Legionella rubrilucens]KTD49611.1 putative prophage repressor CI-like protein [Legionella rubrilucens]